MSTGSIVQSFERFEFKFWAPQERVSQVLTLLDGVMQEDEVAKQSGTSQVNTSLYLDSRRFVFLEQHLAGLADRIKLRVRYYGLAPKGPCFFEIKRRQNMVVMKQRAVVTLDQTRALLGDLTRPAPAEHADNVALQHFQYLALRCQAEPKLLVRAQRAAYRSVDPAVDVRLTIDRDVQWQPPPRADPLTPNPDSWRAVSGNEGRALVEVKFREARPWWLGVLARQLAPWRVSFSKYVAAALEARKDPFFTADAA